MLANKEEKNKNKDRRCSHPTIFPKVLLPVTLNIYQNYKSVWGSGLSLSFLVLKNFQWLFQNGALLNFRSMSLHGFPFGDMSQRPHL